MIAQNIKNTTIKFTALFLLISPSITDALQGTFITEPFSCEVSLADKKELQRSTKENNPTFVQEQLEVSLKAVIEELAKHSECRGTE